MFKKIFFEIDENGKPIKHDLIRCLTVKDLNCKNFVLYDDTQSGSKIIRITRSGLLNVDKDPYNDDGRPPTCLFSIINPTVRFLGSEVIITGFEEPNLVMAGLMREPYGTPHKNSPIKQKMDARDSERYSPHDITYGRNVPPSLYAQSITLVA